MKNGATGLLSSLLPIVGVYKKIASGIGAVVAKKKAAIAVTKTEQAAEMTSTGIKAAGSAASIPITGWVIAAGILAAVGLAA